MAWHGKEIHDKKRPSPETEHLLNIGGILEWGCSGRNVVGDDPGEDPFVAKKENELVPYELGFFLFL